MQHEAALRAIQYATRQIAKTFDKPDDDWEPTALIFSGGEATVVGLSFSDEEEKMAAFNQLVGIARAFNADAVAVALSAWLVVQDPEDAPPTTRLAEHPDRQEALIVAVASPGRATFQHALIERDGVHGPSLGPWVGEGDDGERGGALLGLLARAVSPQG